MFVRFYIGCDRCDDWYHGSCVGVTKSEADRMDTYICPVCRQKESEVAGGDADSSSVPLQERHWLELRRIVTSLQVNRNSGQPFFGIAVHLENQESYKMAQMLLRYIQHFGFAVCAKLKMGHNP